MAFPNHRGMELEKTVDQMDRTLDNVLEQVVGLDAALVKDGERAAIQMESVLAEINNLKKRLDEMDKRISKIVRMT